MSLRELSGPSHTDQGRPTGGGPAPLGSLIGIAVVAMACSGQDGQARSGLGADGTRDPRGDSTAGGGARGEPLAAPPAQSTGPDGESPQAVATTGAPSDPGGGSAMTVPGRAPNTVEETTAGAAWCQVESMLATHCGNCHGSTPTYGAPMSLVSHEDLMAPSPTDGRPSFAVVTERIEDERRPMPPAPNPRLSDDDTALLTAWVEAGTPASGNCERTHGPTQVEENEECLDCGNYSCTDGTPMRFLAHGSSTPDDTTPLDLSEVGGPATLGDPNFYSCFYFKAPWGENAIASGFRPVIDNKRILHHWLLYASKDAPPDLSDGLVRGECQAQGDPNRVLLGGWAPGRPGERYPDDLGQELPFGPNTMITLEIHYYNTSPGEPALDRSGGELCLAPAPRKHVMGAHWLGTENINVPPGSAATPGDTCTPNLSAGQTATLISLTPHMHEVGRHAKLEIMRADGRVEVIHDGPFGFEDQTLYTFDEPVVVHPQDRLRATCTFENEGAVPIGFGDGTNEEMCYLFVQAYPVGALHNGLNGCYGPFCLPGADRRCIDNEDILHGIGGLF